MNARCAAIFDRMRPGLEGQWEATLPLDLFHKLRNNVANLKVEFIKDCPSMSKEDLACAEGDSTAAIAECQAQPEDKREQRMYEADRDATNPLNCKGITALMDGTGARWMKMYGLDQ